MLSFSCCVLLFVLQDFKKHDFRDKDLGKFVQMMPVENTVIRLNVIVNTSRVIPAGHMNLRDVCKMHMYCNYCCAGLVHLISALVCMVNYLLSPSLD